MSDVTIEQSPSGIFARTSSGLVRTVSTFDTFFFCMIVINLGIGLLNLIGLVFYPGASIEIATLIAIVGSLCLGISYALFSAIYPRSGAEYVPLSRATHPLIGFVGSFSNAFWTTFFFGVAPAYAATFGWAPLLTMLGAQLGNEGLINLGLWFDSSVGWFVAGIIFITATAWIIYRGMSFYFRIQRWIYGIAIAGFLVFLLVLLLGGVGVFDFQANYNAYVGEGAYDQLLATAAADGIDASAPFDWRMTLNFIIWPAFAVLFAVVSTSFSGEIKNVTRGQLIAIPLSQVVAGILLVLMAVLARMSVTQDGVLAVGWVTNVYPDQFPFYPWMTTLASIMADSPLLTIIITGGILLMQLIGLSVSAIYGTRALLAWGIDGMAPSWVAETSERYHSPKNAILVVTGLAVIFLAMFCFTDWFKVLAAQIGMGIVFMVMAIAAAIFPFTKRKVYEASPARFQVGGIPLMTVTGVVGAVVMGFIVYRTIIDDIFGANSPVAIGMTIGAFVVGAIWYFVARVVRRNQGVDMEARFKEIPVE
jgi:amino acid transporter